MADPRSADGERTASERRSAGQSDGGTAPSTTLLTARGSESGHYPHARHRLQHPARHTSWPRCSPLVVVSGRGGARTDRLHLEAGGRHGTRAGSRLMLRRHSIEGARHRSAAESVTRARSAPSPRVTSVCSLHNFKSTIAPHFGTSFHPVLTQYLNTLYCGAKTRSLPSPPPLSCPGTPGTIRTLAISPSRLDPFATSSAHQAALGTRRPRCSRRRRRRCGGARCRS